MKHRRDAEAFFWRQKIVSTILRITDVERLQCIQTIAQSIENSSAFEAQMNTKEKATAKRTKGEW
jgi:hypothetical protein